MLKNEEIKWNNDKIIPCYELHEIAFKSMQTMSK